MCVPFKKDTFLIYLSACGIWEKLVLYDIKRNMVIIKMFFNYIQCNGKTVLCRIELCKLN